VVPFKIDTKSYDYDEMRNILDTIDTLNDNLDGCITFRPFSEEDDKDYIKIFNSGHCETWYVGNVGVGEHLIGLTSGCVTGKKPIFVYLIRSLGLHFEHQRPDRDKYVRFNEKNLPDNRFYELLMKLFAIRREMDISLPYDGKSILHFKSARFGVNGRDTLESKPSSGIRTSQLGSSSKPTRLDIQKIKLAYNCPR
jgi:hypothetical protein